MTFVYLEREQDKAGIAYWSGSEQYVKVNIGEKEYFQGTGTEFRKVIKPIKTLGDGRILGTRITNKQTIEEILKSSVEIENIPLD